MKITQTDEHENISTRSILKNCMALRLNFNKENFNNSEKSFLKKPPTE
jgi:hypothetical protein